MEDNYTNSNLLVEANRSTLINKSKNGEIVKSYNETRYDRRHKQSVLLSNSVFNKVNFNDLFNKNELTFLLPVKGETDTYQVSVKFKNICDHLKSQISANNYNREYKCIFKALAQDINKFELFVFCTCPDFKYRQAYYASRDNYNSGTPERRKPEITNPGNTAGGSCKHIISTLDNLNWIADLSTSIYNYINFMEDKYPEVFKKYIFPKVYDISYEEYLNSKEPMEDPEDTEEIEELPTEGEPEEIPSEEIVPEEEGVE